MSIPDGQGGIVDGRLVRVSWLDAHFAAEELTSEEAQALKPELTHSVGWLVTQNEHVTVLFMSAFDGHPGKYAEYLVIPRLMVTATVELVEQEPEE